MIIGRIKFSPWKEMLLLWKESLLRQHEWMMSLASLMKGLDTFVSWFPLFKGGSLPGTVNSNYHNHLCCSRSRNGGKILAVDIRIPPLLKIRLRTLLYRLHSGIEGD